MVKSGSSYLSQSELPLTFGLGRPQPDRKVTVEVIWPGGRKESVADVAGNQSITIEEGKGMVAHTAFAFSQPPHAAGT